MLREPHFHLHAAACSVRPGLQRLSGGRVRNKGRDILPGGLPCFGPGSRERGAECVWEAEGWAQTEVPEPSQEGGVQAEMEGWVPQELDRCRCKTGLLAWGCVFCPWCCLGLGPG